MKKIVLKLDLCDDKAKKKALKTVSTIPGIDSISMEMKDKKLTVIGAVDAITIVSKLRKYWPNTDIISVGQWPPEKPPEKKEEGAKAEEGKKDEAKKEGGEDGKKEEGKKEGAEDGKKEGGGDKKEEKKAVPAVVPVYDPMMWEMMKARGGYNNIVPPMLAYNHPQMTYYNPYVASYNSHMSSYGQPQMNTHYVQTQTMDENPNTCTIS